MPRAKVTPQAATPQVRFIALGITNLVLMIVAAIITFVVTLWLDTKGEVDLKLWLVGVGMIVVFAIMAFINAIAIIIWLASPNRKLVPESEIHLALCSIEILATLLLIKYAAGT